MQIILFGNRIITTDTTNNLNQYTEINSIINTYDANANLTNDGKWTYTYDYENRLIKAENSSLTAIYTYDSFGRRTHKDIRDSNEVLLSSTSYFYDGGQVISEYNESDTLLRKYIYGPGIDEPILIENTIGDRYYYHFDGLGSVSELTDSAGTIVEK